MTALLKGRTIIFCCSIFEFKCKLLSPGIRDSLIPISLVLSMNESYIGPFYFVLSLVSFAAVVFSVATVAVSASGVLLSFYCVSELAELSSGH